MPLGMPALPLLDNHRASVVPLGMPALPLKSLVSLGDLLGFDTPELEAITAMRGMSGSSSS